MKLTANARTILEKRYLKKEDSKPVEQPEDMFRRVAEAVASAESIFNQDIGTEDLAKTTDEFYELMTSMDFLPNSPTLMNAGRELGQLSACFVLPVEDSMEAIFTAVKDAALIHKSGGGTGFSFSRIRPKNNPVRSTGGVASGPISFMKVFNAATEAIKQGGTRRGANMGILNVDHPDILEFISSKENNDALTNFNISVGLTKEFMEAVENDSYYDLKFNDKVYDRFNAREVFSLIVDHAWGNGEPGIVFLDRLNEDNPTPGLGQIEATNPCGEQPLLGYEACNLGSINLSNAVKDGKIDWNHLGNIVEKSVRYLDNVIEINNFPLPKIEEMVKGNRKIGLGVMGWADMLFKLLIPYNSEQAVDLAKKVMGFIQEKSHSASRKLAGERGNFPNIALSIYRGKKHRNATCTTIAPTGTISMIAGTSSGIEPSFSIAYTKTVLDGTPLVEVNPIFEEYVRSHFNKDDADEIFNEVAEKGSVQKIDRLPSDIKQVFITALEISPEWHVKMQASFQSYCDNAVSKTVNFPRSATKGEVEEAYMLAYKLGCKGVTVYRSGSREEEVLTLGKGKKKKTTEETNSKEKTLPRPRPKRTIGVTEQVKTGCGRMYITVNYDQQGIIETFITTGSSGGCSGFTEGTSRLISLALRANIAPEAIIDQLMSVSCPTFLRRKANDKSLLGKSCPDIIGRVLKEEMKVRRAESDKPTGKEITNKDKEALIETLEASLQEVSATCLEAGGCENAAVCGRETSAYHELSEDELLQRGICPECFEPMQFAEGCLTCNCGFSKCG